LVEAAEPLRTLAERVLIRAGYEVDEAMDEATAVLMLTQKMRDYAALLIGQTDDDEVGRRVALRAETMRPTLPVVVWSDKPPAMSPSRLVWLRRPWLAGDLLDAVFRALRPTR
jgi:hypothetical protein